MPEITQMFPKKTLDAADYAAALGLGWHTLRIVGVQDKVYEDQRSGEQQLVYFVQVAQLRKPIRLNQTNAYAIVDATGESNSDNWIGRLVQAQAYEKEITENVGGRPRKRRIWVLDFREQAPDTPEVQLHNADLTGTAMQVSKGLMQPGQMLRLGPAQNSTPAPTTPQQPSPARAPNERLTVDNAISVYNAIFRKGKDEAWLRAYITGVAPQLAATVAKPIGQWTYETSPWIKVAVGSLPNINGEMTPASVEALRKRLTQPEVVDTATGEVLPTAQDPAADDIPF